MRYVRFSHAGTTAYGILEAGRVRPMDGTPFDGFVLSNDTYALDSVHLLSPCIPTKGVCIGLNYRDHAEEIHAQVPKNPVVFIKPTGCTIGPYASIVYPALSKRVDYEGELAIVIGRLTKKIAKEEAASHILGYTCANDVTARDLQPPDGQWTVAKGFDTFMPIGPAISTDVDPSALAIECRLNGEVRQRSNTRNLLFSCHFLVSYLSHIMTLYPGDVILTGTPSGIGPMKPGDVVEVEIEGIGTLRNTVTA
ncbi:MAG: fumarylacetoacetate hydrolase family protein [Sphaerochaetaceae bacterium]|nr:fumarylacetoacetate hydrolase family protein [Sphaerochaetaceae bacterium]MDX9940300.1 fumarylacetoacetate hydrolase family protein [Sphaerochaetaceae bacterium]